MVLLALRLCHRHNVFRFGAATGRPFSNSFKQLKAQYEQSTQDMQRRIAALEQQKFNKTSSKKRRNGKKKKVKNVSAAELAAQQAEKSILGQSDQAGAKYQGQIPSEPTYDLLREADRRIEKLQEQVGTFEFHGYFRSGYGLNSVGRATSRFSGAGSRCQIPPRKRSGDLRRADFRQQLGEPRAHVRPRVDENRAHGGGQHHKFGKLCKLRE